MYNFFSTLLHKLAVVLITPTIVMMSWAGYTVEKTPLGSAPIVGASLSIPTAVSFFSTQLATPITASATSMTLVSGTDQTGTSLASSTYAFTIDGQTPTQEVVIADCTGTACTNMQRGIDPLTGVTTVAALQFRHNRGATVNITDAPYLLIANRIINGDATFPNILTYAAGKTCTVSSSGQSLCPKTYIDQTASAGAANANETTAGLVQLSTGAQAAAGTSLGSTGARLSPPNSIASSTYNAASSNVVVVTGGSNTIDHNFIATSSLYRFTGNNTHAGQEVFTATTTLATTTINGVNISSHFGGTGSDGPLALTSGTTTIDLANAAVVTKNYTSISITGSGALAFTNPNANGSIIVLKSQGNVTLTSSATPMIAAYYLGGTAGAGASASANNGTDGTAGQGFTSGSVGGRMGQLTSGTAAIAGTLASTSPTLLVQSINGKSIPVFSGAGGGGGSSTGGVSLSAGSGGRGGGGLYIECGGAFNFTTALGISVAGQTATTNGQSGTIGAGGGGGGSGGSAVIIYNTLTANTGTITINGGAGSSGGTSNSGAGAGGTGGLGGTSSSGTGLGGKSGNVVAASSAVGGNGGSGGTNPALTGGGSAGGDSVNSANSGSGAGGGGGAAGFSLVTANTEFN